MKPASFATDSSCGQSVCGQTPCDPPACTTGATGTAGCEGSNVPCITVVDGIVTSIVDREIEVPTGDGPFALAESDPAIPSGRVVTAGSNITVTDGGPGGALTIASTASGGGAVTFQAIATNFATGITLGFAFATFEPFAIDGDETKAPPFVLDSEPTTCRFSFFQQETNLSNDCDIGFQISATADFSSVLFEDYIALGTTLGLRTAEFTLTGLTGGPPYYVRWGYRNPTTLPTINVTNMAIVFDGGGGGGGGGGTVTDVSVVTANGVSGSVATSTTTPAITLTLGAITPTSVAASGTVTGSNLSGTNTGNQTITLTGDVTGSGTGSFAATIANDAVTYAKMQNVSAASKLLGRGDSGSGDVQEITLGTNLSMSGTTLNASGGGGVGTVTDVSVVTANGVSGSVATSTTTPAITLTLGAITPTSVNGNTITTGTGTLTLSTFTLTAAANASVSGTNTGDQTSVSGNAGTVTVGDAGGDTTTWVLLGTSQTGNLSPSTDAGFTYNATTDAVSATTFIGALSGNASTASAVAVGGITGLGTGVATALAVNVGTSGSFITNGGALGTPSSGTVTNLTGTASININGTVGATTPAAGTFTTLTGTTIEVANTDTTIARGAAGQITVEGNNVFTATKTTANEIDASVFAADAGSTDAYAATLSPAIASYITGNHYRFKANTANTGAATIAFNGLSAVTIVKVAGGITTTLANNDIRSGQWVDLVYDGTNMQMQSLLGNAPSGTGDVVGPGSATDSVPALFDGTTGKLIKNSTPTGTGNPVLATSPTLVTPLLGTPTSGTLTNCTGLPVAGGGTGVASITAYAPVFGGTTTTNPVQSGTVGLVGQVLASNGAGVLPSMQAVTPGALCTILYSDFLQGANLFWGTTSGAFFNTSALDTTHNGLMVINANNVTGLCSNGSVGMTCGGGELVFEAVIQLTRLGTAGDLTIRLGFLDVDTSAAPVDGIWMEFKTGVNSDHWVLYTSNNSSASSSNLSVGPSINTWYRITIVINAAGTSATAFVDGANSPTAITTNIPAAAAREFNMKLVVISTSANLNQMFCDYVFLRQQMTSSR